MKRSIKAALAKMSLVVVIGIGMVAAGGAAFAEPIDNMHACEDAGGSFKACCIGSGGTYSSGTLPSGPYEACSWPAKSAEGSSGPSPSPTPKPYAPTRASYSSGYTYR